MRGGQSLSYGKLLLIGLAAGFITLVVMWPQVAPLLGIQTEGVGLIRTLLR